VEQVADIAHRFIARSLNASATVLVPDGTGELRPVAAAGTPAAIDTAIARAVFERGESMPFADRRNAFAPALCLPLKAPLRIRGVLVIESADRASVMPPAQHALLETVASLLAVVIERLHFVDVARDALVDVESERLRNSLLSAISHDLRTPLTVLVGLADSLTRSRPVLPAAQAEAAAAIRDQSLRMSSLVHNLLDMARLQAGKVRLRKEWQPLEEVIGSSLQGLDARLAKRVVTTRLAPDLPLLEFDAVLIERVLTNLLENAIKYAPGSAVVIEANRQNGEVAITVADDGPGIPAGSEETIFKMFERGRHESHLAGVGLGLAISRAIVEAHGGRLWAGNRPQGGALFTFTLRAGTPPTIDQALLERIAKGDP
jgi:two-component system sensor histidine kinase KdpD